jgi:hypothetical protein
MTTPSRQTATIARPGSRRCRGANSRRWWYSPCRSCCAVRRYALTVLPIAGTISPAIPGGRGTSSPASVISTGAAPGGICTVALWSSSLTGWPPWGRRAQRSQRVQTRARFSRLTSTVALDIALRALPEDLACGGALTLRGPLHSSASHAQPCRAGRGRAYPMAWRRMPISTRHAIWRLQVASLY